MSIPYYAGMENNTNIPTMALNDNTFMPIIGLGTWNLTGEACRKAVSLALEAGYRHIDTASSYGNQKEIGEAIRQSGIPREDLFIVSKIEHSMLEAQNVFKDMEKILSELKTGYTDLLLIHWPNKEIPMEETLQAMAELNQKKLTKALGVSNFTISHLEQALKTGVKITNNQFEFHPSLYQEGLLQFCLENSIAVTAYAPLGRKEDFKLDIVKKISRQRKKPASQVVLNWILQKGAAAIPKSKDPSHIRENLETLEWSLSPDEIKEIDSIDTKNRIVMPEFAEF